MARFNNNDIASGRYYSDPAYGWPSSSMGTWLVGAQITPGTYRATVSYSGCWERMRDFTGEWRSVSQ